MPHTHKDMQERTHETENRTNIPAQSTESSLGAAYLPMRCTIIPLCTHRILCWGNDILRTHILAKQVLQ